jgi:hypothetical protein
LPRSSARSAPARLWVSRSRTLAGTAAQHIDGLFQSLDNQPHLKPVQCSRLEFRSRR